LKLIIAAVLQIPQGQLVRLPELLHVLMTRCCLSLSSHQQALHSATGFAYFKSQKQFLCTELDACHLFWCLQFCCGSSFFGTLWTPDPQYKICVR